MIKKELFFIVSAYAASLGCSSAAQETNSQADPKVIESGKPEVVEVFACSDYCPGPKEKYMVKAYKGVTNADECSRIGGRPYEYVGWGKFFVCIAE